MNQSFTQALAPIRQLHPATLKHLKASHPWITADRFSAQFPAKASCLTFKDGPQQFIFLHDPQHPQVKARRWDVDSSSFDLKMPLTSLLHHLIKAQWFKGINSWIEHRVTSWQSQQRNHGYLFSTHQSLLPGLQVLYLNGHLYIQTQAYYWTAFQQLFVELMSETQQLLQRHSWPLQSLWWQQRTPFRKDQRPAQCLWSVTHQLTSSSQEILIQEHGLTFAVHLGRRYDHGFYSDMSTIRAQAPFHQKEFWQGKSLLNLFSYSGAFSLLAGSKGATPVVSLDQCDFARELFFRNLQLNEALGLGEQQWLKKDIFAGLEYLAKRQQLFDVILFDPPTSFTSRGKVLKTLKCYPELIAAALKILAPKGSLWLFQNTLGEGHQAFTQFIKQQAKEHRLTLKKHWTLEEECLGLSGFPESNYLHGHWLSRTS